MDSDFIFSLKKMQFTVKKNPQNFYLLDRRQEIVQVLGLRLQELKVHELQML